MQPTFLIVTLAILILTSGNGLTQTIIPADTTTLFNITVSGSYALSSGTTRSLATDDAAIRINTNNVTLSIQGSVINLLGNSTNSDGAALRVSGANPQFATVNIGSTTNTAALVQSFGNDAIRFTGVGNSTVSPNTINNYGTVRSDGRINTSGGAANTFLVSDGITMGTNTLLNNYGTVSGARHGVDGGNITGVVINNFAGGSLAGRNGSGIGADTSSTLATNFVVNNWGSITGQYAGTGNIFDRAGNAAINGDGDGIDIDAAATINNYASGLITTTGAGGFDTNGRANNSEAISIGGGVIINAGTIRGANRGIIVNNDGNTNRSAAAATTITNSGTIEGQNGFGIRMEGAFDDTITNTGTITGTGTIPDITATVFLLNGVTADPANGTADGVVYGAGNTRFIRGDGSTIQMGEGNDILINSGTITSANGRAVNMEGGNDSVTLNKGSSITGLVNGGAGTDTLILNIFGLTDAKRAQLAGGGTAFVGGIELTGFETISGASTSVTFQSVSRSAITGGVASALDNSTGSATDAFRGALSQVETAADPEAALRQLTPRNQETIANILVDTATQVTSLTNGRMSAIRNGGPQFDSSGLRVWDPTLDRALQQTKYLLAGTAMDSKSLSDSAKQMAEPTVAIPMGPRWGFFANGNAVFAEQGSTAELQKSDYVTAAITLGADYRLTENFVVGAFGGYSYTDANTDAQGSNTEVDTGLIGIYSTYYSGPWFLDSSFAYGRSFYDNNRLALGSTNTSTPEGDQFSFQNRLGYDFRLGNWTVTPILGGQFTKTIVESYSENGEAALNVQEDEADSFRSSLGGQVQYAWRTSWGTLTPQWRASWIHEFLNDRREIAASFVNLAAPTFTTSTNNPDRDFAVLGTGLSANFAEKWTTSLDYDLELGREDFFAHQINAGIRYAF
jgi:outer membrane autotransporter protein